jgi:protein SCO1/2
MRKLIGVLIILVLYSACKSSNKPATLPILGNREPVTKRVDGKTVTDTVYSTIPDFKFVNQYADTISSKSVDGKIYVADFFFTTCPSICPVMHRNMLNVYNEFKADDNFRILSHTIDAKYDTVPVLKKYADKMGISGNTWWLLHGTKEETYKIAKNYLVSVQDQNPQGEFIHDGYFILVDKQKRLRGTYDGTDPAEVTKLIADIKTLKAEPDEVTAK